MKNEINHLLPWLERCLYTSVFRLWSGLTSGYRPGPTPYVIRFSPSAKIQAIIPGTDLYLNKLAPSVGHKIFSTKEIVGRSSRRRRSKRTDDREETSPPLMKEQFKEDTEVQDHNLVKGREVIDEDLRNPFKEARRTPLTRRIIEFAGLEYKMPNNIKLYDGTTDPEDHLSRFASAANSGEWPMPVWCRMFQQTLDRSARGWIECLPPDSINERADLREAFAARFSVRRACFKDPHEITKIIRRANESLTAFKERWTVETGFIMHTPTLNSLKGNERVPSQDILFIGSPGLKTLRAIPSTTHAVMKFPTLKGVATLVTRTLIIMECKRLEKKQMVEVSLEEKGEVAVTKEVLVNTRSRISQYDRSATANHRSCVQRESFSGSCVTKAENNFNGKEDEKMLLADILETFDNLKKINMKLNPKKCSFGVEEEKFLGYMVTSEGIRANPRKTKNLADLQSPQTLKEMQSLSGKLAALNWFLAKSAERTLNEAKRNYDPMEKLALALIHMTRILRSYIEAHPVKVITDQPIKNILNNIETFKKLVKYAFELGAYSITFIPRNTMKGHVLADFLSEAPKGEKEELVKNSSSDLGWWQARSIEVTKPANYVIREIHMGSCGIYVGPRVVVRKETRQGYYWPTMHEDAKKEWDIDILKPLPLAKGGAKFVIMAIEYFTKWIEAKLLVKITGKEMNTAVVHLQENGLVERANTSLIEGIKTHLGREKARWVNELPNVLWAHQTLMKPGEFLFQRNEASMVEDQGKLGPKWEGSYRVMEAYENGSYKLQTLEDKEVPHTWHAINLHKCYM
nr:reverse transcriptase domain-containing protein [Tanacetum cinerariifolium]